MAKRRITYKMPPLYEPKLHVRRKVWRFFVHVFAWMGIAVLFYIGFSFIFDTPVEHRMKYSTSELKKQYQLLANRYDSITMVLDNVVERDRNVFRLLFEAEPYDLEGDYGEQMLGNYEKLLNKENQDLGKELGARANMLDKKMHELSGSFGRLQEKYAEAGDAVNYIPSIQPIINPELTLLTASFGLRIHPFYKTLTAHNGVDYTVPEGTRVFATADGRVKDIVRARGTQGTTVVLAHGDSYETQYSHLSRVNVARGEQVKRGDIIALTGNTGLSLAPHLHYEIRHNGLRVDPIHYFFMELSPADYQKMTRIARSGMQSFD